MKTIVNNFKSILEQAFTKGDIDELMKSFNLNDDSFDEWLKSQMLGQLQTEYGFYLDKSIIDEDNIKHGKPSPYILPYPEHLYLMKANMNSIQEDIELLQNKNAVRKNILEEVFRILINFSKIHF